MLLWSDPNDTAGLTAAGKKVPDEVPAVGHANFPVAPAKVLPVRLLGYDAKLLLRTCVELIDRQRAGEQVPGETVIPMLWEEEISEPSTVNSRSVGRRRKMVAKTAARLETAVPAVS